MNQINIHYPPDAIDTAPVGIVRIYPECGSIAIHSEFMGEQLPVKSIDYDSFMSKRRIYRAIDKAVHSLSNRADNAFSPNDAHDTAAAYELIQRFTN